MRHCQLSKPPGILQKSEKLDQEKSQPLYSCSKGCTCKMTVLHLPQDIADAIAQMHQKARYRQLLLFVETCEAETLTSKVYSPDVLTIATSKLGSLFIIDLHNLLPGHHPLTNV